VSKTTLELITFTLKSDITESQWSELQPSLDTFLLEQEGFLYRSLTKGDDGIWFDAIYWRSIENAQKVGELFPKSEIGQQLCALIDEKSVTMRLMEVVAESMGACDSAAA
jgi:hypothetical protein|tara:strand:+ start:4879 stop:5208 length:330 start_codon:yes stop_codon:yes gene_type:complete